jgi:uncharacterized membrane protein
MDEITGNKAISDKKLFSILASPVLLPVLIGAAVIYLMFLGCGWLFVAMSFFTSAGAAALGIVGIVGAFANAANGIDAFLVMAGCGLIGIGLAYPIFRVSLEFCKGFSVLSSTMVAKLGELKKRWLEK